MFSFPIFVVAELKRMSNSLNFLRWSTESIKLIHAEKKIELTSYTYRYRIGESAAIQSVLVHKTLAPETGKEDE